ncbi:MAG TPA: sigma-70 family RNA polymerase sigma factor [Nannocystaceae bacterium]|nr:sigma-70 family RNA polymerase sigma factor [Nannocystaceae bacterium]
MTAVRRNVDGSDGLAGRGDEDVGMPAPDPGATPGVGDTFDEVYAEHFAFVWRSLRALGVDSAAVDDAAQDVFIVVHDRLHTYDGRVKLRGWLFGIARNVARKHRERRGRTSPLQLVGEPAPLDETLQWRERASIVARFLDGLDEEQRAVFVLAQLEGATAPEIAAALGVNLNTVYSRLRTARARFARAMERVELRERSESRG